MVKKGQPLLRIDAASYEQQVIQAQSGIDQAENDLANQTQTIQQRKADIAAQAKTDQAQAAYELSRG